MRHQALIFSLVILVGLAALVVELKLCFTIQVQTGCYFCRWGFQSSCFYGWQGHPFCQSRNKQPTNKEWKGTNNDCYSFVWTKKKRTMNKQEEVNKQTRKKKNEWTANRQLLPYFQYIESRSSIKKCLNNFTERSLFKLLSADVFLCSART